jgi:arylsulfatase A-like enzyme
VEQDALHGRRKAPRGPAPLLRYRDAVRRIVGIALAAALVCGGCSGEAPRRPNLLLVTVDTLRPDRLGCYGGPDDVGLAMCALGRAGTRFEWAFSTAPTTAPSVASILTSRYAGQHRVTQHARSYLGAELPTLAETLRGAGYHTAAFVSNPILQRRKRFDRGFDRYDDEMTRRESNRPHFTERDARDTSDAALAWAQAEARSPWFLWVHYQDPHGPYEPPRAPPARDAPGGPRLPVLETDSGRGGIPSYQALTGAFHVRTYEGRYLDEIRFLDREVGRLVSGLDALGDPPSVLLASDHGEAFGEDGYYFAHGHSTGLDQIRVPLLWRPPPGRRGAGVVKDSVSLVDVAPSLLELAGLPQPEGFVGRPLPLGADAKAGEERAIFAEQDRRAAVVRGRRYYARERDPAARVRPDGRPWGDENPALPPRTARLGSGPALPPYRSTPNDPPEDLETALRDHLEALPEGPGHRHAEVPAGVREQLRALGYADER